MFCCVRWWRRQDRTGQDRKRNPGGYILMICIDRDPTQDKMTNNCCCATEQARPRYFSTRMSVPCQFFNNNNNNNGQSTRNKQGVTVATATANHSSMGKPNISTGCYISQFTYNLQKFLFPPPPLRNFVVYLDPLLGILHRINLSALCVQQGKSCESAIHLLHASPLQSASLSVAY